jgi:uncharacterized membrane protein
MTRRALTYLHVLEAFIAIVVCEQCLRMFGFSALHHLVRRFPTIGQRRNTNIVSEHVAMLSAAIDTALPIAAFRSYCLTRSAATVCLLRLHGIRAHLVIGVAQFPFAAHAWIEVAGISFHDPLEVFEHYSILERL